MAYTYDQLVLAYKAVHDGIAPDAATQALFQTQAVLSANGQLTDAQLLGNIINSADNSTALAVLSYQFFTGKSPTAAGLDYLVNSANNSNDLNDAYYSKFSLENRYINFAANLGVQGEGAANFASQYGAMSFSDYVASIYQTIIGGSYAQAAGIDPAAAIASIISRKDAILATAQSAGMIPANATAAQIDLALKAATAGYLLGEAIKADVGLYAAAANNFMAALAQGNAVYNTNLTYTYQPSVSSFSHGTGKAVDAAPTVLPAPPAPPTATTPVVTEPTYTFSLVLGSGVDHIRGTSANERFTATDTTFQATDFLDGGAGSNDRLTVAGVVAGTYVVPSLAHVSNVEWIILNNSGGGITADATGSTGVTRLDVAGDGGPVTVTSLASIANTSVSADHQGANTVVVNADGDATNVTATGATTGTVTINALGASSSSSIAATVTTAGVTTGGLITINGGGDMYADQEVTNAVNTTTTLGAVTFNCSAVSYSVAKKGAGEVAADGTHAGVIGGAITVNDYNTVHTLGAGTIYSVYLQGFHNATINDNAVNDLQLQQGSGDVTINNSYNPAGSAHSLTVKMWGGANIGHLSDSGYYTDLTLREQGVSTIADLDFAAVTALHITAGSGSMTLTSTAHMTALQTVDFSGGGLTASFGGSTLTTFDASQANQNNTIDFSAMTSAITFSDSSHADKITLNGLANSVTLNRSGADQVIVAAVTADVNTFTTITNYYTGLKVGFAAHGTEFFNQTMVADAGTLRDTADAAIASLADGTTNGQLAWFQYGGNTYIVESTQATHAHFDDGHDFIVKLTGDFVQQDLSGASISGHLVSW